MNDRLLGIIRYIVPPKDKEGVTGWRWGIFIVVVILSLNAASGRGILGGYGAHAAAADVKTILELQYAEVIRDLHDQICKIRPVANPTLQNTLEDYQRRYRDLTGKRYPLSPCP